MEKASFDKIEERLNRLLSLFNLNQTQMAEKFGMKPNSWGQVKLGNIEPSGQFLAMIDALEEIWNLQQQIAKQEKDIKTVADAIMILTQHSEKAEKLKSALTAAGTGISHVENRDKDHGGTLEVAPISSKKKRSKALEK